VKASWSGMRALKILRHLGIHLKFASEAAVKEHVDEITVPWNGNKTVALVSCC